MKSIDRTATTRVQGARWFDLDGALRHSARWVRCGQGAPWRVLDPVAEQVLASGATQGLAEQLAALDLTRFRPLSGGLSSVVLDVGAVVVRMGEWRSGPRLAIPTLLPNQAWGQAGRVGWEVLARADQSGLAEAHVAAMIEQCAAAGWAFHDPGTDNLGWVDRRLYILDPGAVGLPAPAGPPLGNRERLAAALARLQRPLPPA